MTVRGAPPRGSLPMLTTTDVAMLAGATTVLDKATRDVSIFASFADQ